MADIANSTVAPSAGAILPLSDGIEAIWRTSLQQQRLLLQIEHLAAIIAETAEASAEYNDTRVMVCAQMIQNVAATAQKQAEDIEGASMQVSSLAAERS